MIIGKIFRTIAFIILFPIIVAGQSALVLEDALDALNNHIAGSFTLSTSQLDLYQADVINNDVLFESNSDLITLAFEVASAYESTYGPLWLNNKTRDVNIPREQSGGLELEMAIIAVMQGLLDHAYTPENIIRFRNILEHKMFETSEYFPGACDPPANPSVTYDVKINASQDKPWGVPVMYDDKPARRPTGCYVAPGSFVTVTVPASLVNKDFSIRVGAHSWDLSNKPRYERLDRISLLYPITSPETVVANPIGGGIYIEVPIAANAGIVTITVTNAAPSPFYSDKPWHKTTVSDWINTERNHPGPWADFESEKYMMQVPTNWIYNLDTPDETLGKWDTAMDYVSDLTGKPRVRNGQTVLYQQVDVIIKGSAYHPGYPMSNDPYNPLKDMNGNSDHYFITGPGERNSTTFHELGHAEHITKFPGETEAVVNFLYVAAMNQGFGFSLDKAFSYSMGNSGSISKDQAAIMWMVAKNFRQGNPMDITNSTKNEVRYQHRGYGKYVEIADLFGWEALNNFWHSVNVDYMNGISYNRNNDEADSRILRLSRQAGADLRPLVHFWGVHPNNDAQLKADIESEGLMPSSFIYDQLMHYKSIIPMNNAGFIEHADIVSPNRNASANPDYGSGWYYVWASLYNESHGDSAVTAIQDIIDHYFPDGRPDSEVVTLTVNNGTGDGDYYEGEIVTISADQAPQGKMFDHWTVNSGNARFDNENAPNTTVKILSGNVTVSAVFADDNGDLRDPENPLNAQSGLEYKYYQGDWDLMPDFETLTPVKSGTVNKFDLNDKMQDDYFGFCFTGYVDIPANGTYTFYTESDDGSKLYIGSTLVVDNDGVHGMREESGEIDLKAGKHSIRVDFFERAGGANLIVNYEGPGIDKQSMPASVLYYGGDTTTIYDSNNNPVKFYLAQNYPNPFNPSTTVPFYLAERAHVKLRVYDIIGNLIETLVDDVREPGNHETLFTASHMPSGVYLLNMQAGNYNGLQKMMLIK